MLGGESARKFFKAVASMVRCLCIVASRLSGGENGVDLRGDERGFVLYMGWCVEGTACTRRL